MMISKDKEEKEILPDQNDVEVKKISHPEDSIQGAV